MSEIGIYQVDAKWAPAQSPAEPYPVSFLVFQGIGDRERAAIVLRAEKEGNNPLPLGALLSKLPVSRVWKYALANAMRKEIQSALDGFKQSLVALMRKAQASRVQICPDEIVARGGAITGFFMRREGTVRHQAGGTRVHVMTFGVRSPGTSVPFDLSQRLQEATQALQIKREKGKDVAELTLTSHALYNDLLSLRRSQVEAKRAAETAYREIVAEIAKVNHDIQATLRIVREGQLQPVGARSLDLRIVEGIAFSLKQPGAVPSQDDPIAAIFIWGVEEKLVAVSETREYFVLRWPREGDEEKQAQEEQE